MEKSFEFSNTIVSLINFTYESRDFITTKIFVVNGGDIDGVVSASLR